MVPLPLPGGGSFALGVAGGPLVTALVLGWLGRTGPIGWRMPVVANLVLRNLGLSIFIGVVAIGAGTPFVETVASNGIPILLGGAAVLLTLVLIVLEVDTRCASRSTTCSASAQARPATRRSSPRQRLAPTTARCRLRDLLPVRDDRRDHRGQVLLRWTADAPVAMKILNYRYALTSYRIRVALPFVATVLPVVARLVHTMGDWLLVTGRIDLSSFLACISRGTSSLTRSSLNVVPRVHFRFARGDPDCERILRRASLTTLCAIIAYGTLWRISSSRCSWPCASRTRSTRRSINSIFWWPASSVFFRSCCFSISSITRQECCVR
jgi:hypothetical protein